MAKKLKSEIGNSPNVNMKLNEFPHCKALFVPTMSEYVKGYHTLAKRKLNENWPAEQVRAHMTELLPKLNYWKKSNA